MMGTLAKVLAESKIRTHHNLFVAHAAGDIEDVDGILKITRIHVHYTLKVEEKKQKAANAALGAYLTQCPAAQSVIGCIDISHELRLEAMGKI